MTQLSSRWIMRTTVLFLTVVVAFLLGQYMSSAANAPRIQYRVVEPLSLDNDRLEAQLNEYGHAGWELALVDIGNVTKPTPRLILKRVIAAQ
jgi:hypothetical protein